MFVLAKHVEVSSFNEIAVSLLINISGRQSSVGVWHKLGSQHLSPGGIATKEPTSLNLTGQFGCSELRNALGSSRKKLDPCRRAASSPSGREQDKDYWRRKLMLC
jgi:hypothetical protein